MTPATTKQFPTIADYQQRMEAAWREVERLSPPSHQVRNCQADLDAETFALRKYQTARHQYLEACKMEGINP